jgi:hypothetical protein
MKLIYTKEGISKSEKEEWRVIIFNNLLDGLRMIIDAMEDMGIDFQYDNTTVSERKIRDMSSVLLLAPPGRGPATNAC